MTQIDKEKFDSLNQTSYLFRLSLNRLGFDIQPMKLTDNVVWHVVYNTTVIGTVTFRTTETGFTFCNIRLYKYLKQKFNNKIDDFILSKYYSFDEDGKPTKIDFEKFDKYFDKIAANFVSKDSKDVITEPDTIDDCISRLTEYCDEFDDQFSKNTLMHDIKTLLQENDKLHKRLDTITNKLITLI